MEIKLYLFFKYLKYLGKFFSELFSHTTRFFIIVENKYSLLKPILSRFCEIYVPQPLIDKTVINLHNINVTKVYNDQTNIAKKKVWLKNKLLMISKTHNLNVPLYLYKS